MKVVSKNTMYVMYGLAFAGLFSFLGWMVYYTWTLGSDEDDYNIVCISGHEYWRANFSYKGFLGIKLDDDGKPVSCNRYGS